MATKPIKEMLNLINCYRNAKQSYSKGWEMAESTKCVQCKHEDPQHPHTGQALWCPSANLGWNWGSIPGAQWPVSLAESRSLRLNERPCLKK